MIAAAGHISGDTYNPAITIGLAIAGKLTPVQTVVYIVAQMLGAVAAALAIGLTITMDIFAMGAVSSAAMNPARHFGPALVDNRWTDAWIWYVGPIAGAALAAVLYNWVLLDEEVPGAAPRDQEGAQLPDREQPAPRRRRRRR